MSLGRDEGADTQVNNALGRGNSLCKGPEAERCLLVKGITKRGCLGGSTVEHLPSAQGVIPVQGSSPTSGSL